MRNVKSIHAAKLLLSLQHLTKTTQIAEHGAGNREEDTRRLSKDSVGSLCKFSHI